MSWSSQTLKDAFPSQFAGAQSVISTAQSAITAIEAAGGPEEKVTQMLSDANSAVSQAETLIAQLEASGLYVLAITPAIGSWSTRIAGAEGAPPRDGAMYCAVMAQIFVGASPAAIGGAYASMKAALTEPMRIKEIKPDPLSTAVLVPEGSAEWPDEDSWDSLTVGDLFPGQIVSARAGLNSARKALTLAQNAKDALDAKKQAFEDSLYKAQQTKNALESTGVYSVLLPPLAGDWLTRMTTQPGAPPQDSMSFCAGSVTVIQAADLAFVTDRWNSLVGALT